MVNLIILLVSSLLLKLTSDTDIVMSILTILAMFSSYGSETIGFPFLLFDLLNNIPQIPPPYQPRKIIYLSGGFIHYDHH